MLAGDKIVTVNGKLYKGMHMKDVVAEIRGKAGDAVTLSILRGDKLLPFTVTRSTRVAGPTTLPMGTGSAAYAVTSTSVKRV